jgi:hypothetical protein
MHLQVLLTRTEQGIFHCYKNISTKNSTIWWIHVEKAFIFHVLNHFYTVMHFACLIMFNFKTNMCCLVGYTGHISTSFSCLSFLFYSTHSSRFISRRLGRVVQCIFPSLEFSCTLSKRPFYIYFKRNLQNVLKLILK